jgi:hypothetical protein
MSRAGGDGVVSVSKLLNLAAVHLRSPFSNNEVLKFYGLSLLILFVSRIRVLIPPSVHVLIGKIMP